MRVYHGSLVLARAGENKAYDKNICHPATARITIPWQNRSAAVEVYVALEYGLRMSEIAHNIMSSVKFSIEKMLGVPVLQVNVNIQGLAHSTAPETR